MTYTPERKDAMLTRKFKGKTVASVWTTMGHDRVQQYEVRFEDGTTWHILAQLIGPPEEDTMQAEIISFINFFKKD